MPNHGKCSHPWTVHTSRLLMSKNCIKNVLENLFLMFGREKTQNRAKTHCPSMSAFSAIFVLKENGTQSHSAKFLNWGDHVISVPDLAASPPWFELSWQCFKVTTVLAIKGKFSKSFRLVKSLPILRNRNERNLNLSCPRSSTRNRFAFREGEEKEANLTSNFLVDWHVKNGN